MITELLLVYLVKSKLIFYLLISCVALLISYVKEVKELKEIEKIFTSEEF